MSRTRRAVGHAFGNTARVVRRGAARITLPRGRFWLRLRLASPVPELPMPGLFGRPPQLSLLEVLSVLDVAERDPRVAGVVVRMHGAPGGLARAESLRRGFSKFAASGRPVIVWSEGYDGVSLLAASGASHLVLPESGGVQLTGLRLSSIHLRGLLDRLGLRADVVSVGDFKSAGEMFTREAPSAAAREQTEALADDLFEVLTSGIAAGRGMSPERVRELVDQGPFRAPQALELGLVDRCSYPDELEALLLELEPELGEPDAVPAVDAAAWWGLRGSDDGWLPLLRERPRIAYVVASGGIHAGRGARGIASDTYRELLEGLRADDGLAGVVVRIDSPGGDAVASDLLWRSLRRVREKRPVVASIGDVAASGGYFLAAAGDAILLEPGSLTGSIGVVGGKLDASGLYERLGIAKDSVERGARAGLLTEERGFTPGERRALRRDMSSIYDLFIDRVASGRGLDPAAVRAVGDGRVWSGLRGLENGLGDARGGPLEALAEVRQRAGLGADEAVTLEIHPRVPLAALLRDRLLPFGLRLGRVAQPLV